jgi:hypothetical protein
MILSLILFHQKEETEKYSKLTKEMARMQIEHEEEMLQLEEEYEFELASTQGI